MHHKSICKCTIRLRTNLSRLKLGRSSYSFIFNIALELLCFLCQRLCTRVDGPCADVGGSELRSVLAGDRTRVTRRVGRGDRETRNGKSHQPHINKYRLTPPQSLQQTNRHSRPNDSNAIGYSTLLRIQTAFFEHSHIHSKKNECHCCAILN